MGITNTPPSATLCGILSKSSGPITIMMKMIIVALCVAAAVAVPIQDEESLEVSVEQTQEFGIIKKAWNHVFKKDVSEADVSCKMENCSAGQVREVQHSPRELLPGMHASPRHRAVMVARSPAQSTRVAHARFTATSSSDGSFGTHLGAIKEV